MFIRSCDPRSVEARLEAHVVATVQRIAPRELIRRGIFEHRQGPHGLTVARVRIHVLGPTVEPGRVVTLAATGHRWDGAELEVDLLAATEDGERAVDFGGEFHGVPQRRVEATWHLGVPIRRAIRVVIVR